MICTNSSLSLLGTDGPFRAQLEGRLGQYHVYRTGCRRCRPAAAGELQRVEAALLHFVSLAGRLLRTEHVCRCVGFT